MIGIAALGQALRPLLDASRNPHSREGLAFTAYKVVSFWPEVKDRKANPNWPDEVKKPMLEAEQMLDSKFSPSVIISTCRSILDVCTKKLGAEKGNLASRIDKLSEMGILTSSMKDWAHAVREIGNEAVHELGGGTHDDAKELLEFIRLFLHLAFELPVEIERLKPKTAKDT